MKDYKLSIDGTAITTTKPNKRLLDSLAGDTGRTIYKKEVRGGSKIQSIFIADLEEHKRNDDVKVLITSYEDKVKAKMGNISDTFQYRFILSEHVDGGEGNLEGSKLIKTYQQIKGKPCTRKEYLQYIMNFM